MIVFSCKNSPAFINIFTFIATVTGILLLFAIGRLNEKTIRQEMATTYISGVEGNSITSKAESELSESSSHFGTWSCLCTQRENIVFLFDEHQHPPYTSIFTTNATAFTEV